MDDKNFSMLINLVRNDFKESTIIYYQELLQQSFVDGVPLPIENIYFSLTFLRYFPIKEEKDHLSIHLFLEALYQSYQDGNMCLSLPFSSPFLKQELLPTQFFSQYLVTKDPAPNWKFPIVIYKNDEKQEYSCYVNQFYFSCKDLKLSLERLKNLPIVEGLSEKMDQLVEYYQTFLSFTLNEEQQNVLKKALTLPFSIIKGGPGTGKTTLVMLFIESFLTITPKKQEALNIVVLGFTGRSVARVQESLSGMIESHPQFSRLKSLIEHSHIHFQTIDHFLLTHQQDPFMGEILTDQVDLMIIDELSMVAVTELSYILKHIGINTKVIMIGDPYQLPSLEAGAVFDLLSSSYFGLENYTLSLKKSMRSKNQLLNALLLSIQQSYLTQQSLLYQNQYSKRLGLPLASSQAFFAEKDLKNLFEYSKENQLGDLLKTEKDGVYFIKLEDDQFYYEQQKILENLFNSYYVKNLKDIVGDNSDHNKDLMITQALTMVDKFRILSPLNKGMLGVKDINQQYAELYRFYFGEEFYGQPCLITKNLPHLNLSNGDMGVVVEDQFYIKKGSLIYTIALNKIEFYDISFATSIHKSQGSEYHTVVIVLPLHTKASLLTRQIIYTALSRAKSKVIVVGSETILLKALNTVYKRDGGVFSS